MPTPRNDVHYVGSIGGIAAVFVRPARGEAAPAQ
jgi:hypothetical protein